MTRRLRRQLGASAAALALALAHAGPARGALFQVTKTDDTDDGACDTDCSLREAVLAANQFAGADVVQIPAGTYTLSRLGNDDIGSFGDLDVHQDLTLRGAGVDATILDGARIDRVIDAPTPQKASLTVEDLSVRNGEVAGCGGGIKAEGNLTLRRVALLGNRANTGAGLCNFEVAQLRDVTLDGNQTRPDDNPNDEDVRTGGAIDNRLAEAHLVNVTVSNNDGGAFAGGIDNQDGMLEVVNSTFSGNRAEEGGAIWSDHIVELSNVTFVGNTDSADDFALVNTPPGSYQIQNSVFDNRPGLDCSTTTDITSGGHNLESGTSCGVGAQVADPLLGPLADNGGPTWTHAPLAGSPTLDAGSNDPCPDDDQRGAARPADADGDGQAFCDIGAVELPEPGAALAHLAALAALGIVGRRARCASRRSDRRPQYQGDALR